jgi:hypothetical protein
MGFRLEMSLDGRSIRCFPGVEFRGVCCTQRGSAKVPTGARVVEMPPHSWIPVYTRGGLTRAIPR